MFYVDFNKGSEMWQLRHCYTDYVVATFHHEIEALKAMGPMNKATCCPLAEHMAEI